MNKGISLSLDSEAFNGFKSDFKQLLNSTLSTMQEKGVDVASITAKFEITLVKNANPNLDAPDSESEREVTSPMFKHKITAAMNLKSERAGKLGGFDYELVWDKDAGTFAMMPIKDGQTSFFDEDYQDGGDDACMLSEEEEKLYEQAVALTKGLKSITSSYLMRKLKLGYNQTVKIMDALEYRGVVGPYNGQDPREVLGADGGDAE